jgi:hypothetical protein
MSIISQLDISTGNRCQGMRACWFVDDDNNNIVCTHAEIAFQKSAMVTRRGELIVA